MSNSAAPKGSGGSLFAAIGKITRYLRVYSRGGAPTFVSMQREFRSTVELVRKLVEGALAALDRGDRASHDGLVVEASRELRDCDVVALAQYSMAPAAAEVAAATGRPVLTTPDS